MRRDNLWTRWELHAPREWSFYLLYFPRVWQKHRRIPGMSLIYDGRISFTSSIFSYIRTKNYMRLAPAGEDAANNLQEARGTWWVAWKTGISVGFMGWSRVTSWSSLERSPGEGERASRPAGWPRCRGPLPLKKTRDRPTGDNSCGIANEPSGHPNDGWLGGTRTQTPREASIHLEKIPLFGAPFPLLPLRHPLAFSIDWRCLKYPEAFPLLSSKKEKQESEGRGS